MCESQREDFRKFEGNAQGFRTICNLQNPEQRGGLQLTSAVLGAFTKYPRASIVNGDSYKTGMSGHKFGFMKSESDFFSEVASELGLISKGDASFAWHRHPLAFLVEAADNICYCIMDVEDGFKVGVICESDLLGLYDPLIDQKVRSKLGTINESQRKAEYLRAITIHKLISEVHDVFANNYDEIMVGKFDSEFTDCMKSAEPFSKFKEMAKRRVYTARSVLEIEACGFEVIGGLLSAFTDAIQVKATGNSVGKIRSRTILGLLPEGTSIRGLTSYQRVQVVTDFVSGMTDSYAVELYQRIRGIALP
jgi:dGTPase